jgi:hypothetical protein
VWVFRSAITGATALDYMLLTVIPLLCVVGYAGVYHRELSGPRARPPGPGAPPADHQHDRHERPGPLGVRLLSGEGRAQYFVGASRMQ